MHGNRRWEHDEDPKRAFRALVNDCGVRVERMPGGGLFFSCDRPEYGREVLTTDVAEAAAAFCRSKALSSMDVLWGVPLTQEEVDGVTPAKALYWLSGGDREWLHGTHYRVRWDTVCNAFVAKFGPRVTAAALTSGTLGELKSTLYGVCRLQELYDFAQSNGWTNPRQEK